VTTFVVRGKAGGKTFAAVQWLREDPFRRVIVTADQARAVAIREQYGLSASQVMSCGGKLESPRGIRAGADFEFAIEDADELLARAFWFKVGLVTASGDCGHDADRPNPETAAAR
jgi:hypothetical protein